MAQMPPPGRLLRNPMAAALRRAGDPHLPYPRAQVIGTNGKGSAAFFLARLLGAHGLKCGLYTSPHLTDLRERIVFDGEMISRAEFGRLYKDLGPVFREFSLTHFERLTLLAAVFFRRKKADFAVLETGIGGTGDAVSALASPELLYTSVALEHREMLGRTLREIAVKKAGPMENAARAFVSPLIQGTALAVLRAAAIRNGAELVSAGGVNPALSAEGTAFSWRGAEYRLPMFGAHYAANAALALETASALLGGKFSRALSARALRGAFWAGRLQFYSFPACNRLLVSCAHNPESFAADLAALRSMQAKGLIPERGFDILTGFSGPRDGKIYLKRLRGLGGNITVTKVPGHGQAFEKISASPGVEVQEDLAAALRAAVGPRPRRRGLVLLIGSIYLAGAALGLLGSPAVRKR